MRLFLGLCLASVFAGGIVHADQTAEVSAVAEKSHWYCVSESPSNPMSSGHIGYGHGATREQAASRAEENCRMDGGFSCSTQCFPE
jgi:hypothetical protein